MSAVFADTWFFLAILNRNDPGHAQAAELSRTDRRHRFTTTWVLTEVGDALGHPIEAPSVPAAALRGRLLRFTLAACAFRTQQLLELRIQRCGAPRLCCFTFPDDQHAPAEFSQSALMEFVARRVAFQFVHPPLASMRRRRAVPAAAMAMPETAVDEDRDLVFWKKNIRPDISNQETWNRGVSFPGFMGS